MTTTRPRPEVPAAAGAWRTPLRLAYGVAVLALVVPRLHSGSALWLDEALSVDIARLPVADLVAALRHDGSPPLYYLLLHGWIAVLGTGDTAVRSLSTVCSLLALPVAHAVGRRLVGPRRGADLGAWTLLVVAASPFAIRYATETRMYSLVMLLALGGILAAQRALERATPGRLATVALAAGLLALTHYWTFFLLAAGELALLVLARRERWRGPAARVALTMPLGGLLFLPWLPVFVFQVRHTGTPWRSPPTWRDGYLTWLHWQGPGPGRLDVALGVLVLLLALAGARCREGRLLLTWGLGALVLGLVVCRVQGAAFALRYSAPVLVPVLVGVALGLASLRPRTRRLAGVALTVLALSTVAFTPLLATRTQAATTARLLRGDIGPADLVVYCPDQLGPAVARLLPSSVQQVVYPTMAPPQLIDWVDYAARNAAASPADFARRVDARTTGTVWLLRADGYLTFGDQCAELDRDLAVLRGSREVRELPTAQRDSGRLVEYRPPSG